MIGVSDTSQEMLSTALRVVLQVYALHASGSRINPIKRYLCYVTSLSKTPKFVTYIRQITHKYVNYSIKMCFFFQY